jgi:hypothetical protein
VDFPDRIQIAELNAMKQSGYILTMIGLVGAGLLSITPAAATVFCDVKKSPDGFAALRAKPDPKAKLLARMKFGDEVQAVTTVPGVNNWMYVIWWKGGRFKSGATAGYDKSDGKGWANRKFIDECG